MKAARDDKRRVTMRYVHDAATGRTTLTVDVEVPEEDMPHEHRRDLREMAEEILGVPLGSLPEGVEVRLKPAGGGGHAHPHPHPEGEHGDGHTHGEGEAGARRGPRGVKQ